MMVDQIDGLNGEMTSNRKRISGRLESTARGFAIVTEPGDYWVLEEFDPDLDLLGSQVVAEGIVNGFDRLKVEWIGSASD